MTGRNSTKPRIAAECCLLDVGQGTCNIVLLGDNRAIIIDCGPRGPAPLRALQHFGVHEIVALVVSHNDRDHYEGATQILENYPHRIHDIFLLEDRPTRRTRFLALLRRELQEGNLLKQPRRLEALPPKGVRIFEDTATSLSLHVLYPWMLANISARELAGPNRTSAVLALQCGHRRIVFGGDLDYAGWQELSRALKAPIRCDVLAVPHHGGALSDADYAPRYRWVYKEAVQCAVAIVSVGTRNQWNHPKADHLRAIVESGANVLCTQITEQCCDSLERLRPGVTQPSTPGASSPTESLTGTGRCRHVACAGSVLVEIGPDSVHVPRLGEHQAAVDRLSDSADGHPLCRLA